MLSNRILWGPIWRQIRLGKILESNLTSDPSRKGCFPTTSFGDRSDLRSVPKRMFYNRVVWGPVWPQLHFETTAFQLVHGIFWNLAWHRIGPQPGWLRLLTLGTDLRSDWSPNWLLAWNWLCFCKFSWSECFPRIAFVTDPGSDRSLK